MRFIGTVQPRSTANPNHGPPSETEIQRLNPSRRTRILEITKWPDLEPGTLNLGVPNSVLAALAKVEAAWVENCSDVTYPEPFTHIPKLRVAYDYYLGVASKDGLEQEILIRKAKVPVPKRVDILAPVNLRGFFDLGDGDSLNVELSPIV